MTSNHLPIYYIKEVKTMFEAQILELEQKKRANNHEIEELQEQIRIIKSENKMLDKAISTLEKLNNRGDESGEADFSEQRDVESYSA